MKNDKLLYHELILKNTMMILSVVPSLNLHDAFDRLWSNTF